MALKVTHMKFSEAPPNVKKIVGLLSGYAIIVAVVTIAFGLQTGFSDRRELAQGVIRFAGVLTMAWWLLSGQKAAWWFTLIVCLLMSCLGILGILLLSLLVLTDTADVWSHLISLIVSVYLLTHASILLLNRETRDFYANRIR
jgi:hypothetical protein